MVCSCLAVLSRQGGVRQSWVQWACGSRNTGGPVRPQYPLKSLFLLQRTCTRRKYTPRTSLSGTPMTSWTKWRIQSLRTHRVTSLRGEGAVHSCLIQFPHKGGTQRLVGHLGQSSPLAPRYALHQHLEYVFCIADGLYHKSGSEFRVASSVEQLNIIEVGAHLDSKRPRMWGGSWVQRTEAEIPGGLHPHLARH